MAEPAAEVIESLPLMRKTFIEAHVIIHADGHLPRLFRLCGRLSLRPREMMSGQVAKQAVSSAYAEDFH